MKKYAVSVSGSKYHGELAQQYLESAYITFAENNHPKIFYHISAPDIKKTNIVNWLNPRNIHIVHWIGNDSVSLSAQKGGLFQKIRDRFKWFLFKLLCKFFCVKNISSAPWIGKDVENRLRVPCPFVIISSLSKAEARKCCDLGQKIEWRQKSVDFLTYIPVAKQDLYSLSDIISAALVVPQRKFLIVSPGLTDVSEFPELPGNIRLLPSQPKEQMRELFLQSKCLIRLKKGGDAYALMVLEAISFGLHVIWNVPDSQFQHIKCVGGKNNFHELLKTSGAGFIDQAGIGKDFDVVHEHMTTEVWLSGVYQTILS